jgi:Mlc titration factor MtfA (ptsG expression regulator)
LSEPTGSTAPSPHEAGILRAAVVSGVLLFAVLVAVALLIVGASPAAIPAVAAAALLALGLERMMSRRIRRRFVVRARAFPPDWRAVLEREVAFYGALDEDKRRRFEDDVQVFLVEKRVTGIGVKLDDTTRVLAAASAVIPVFGFPDWEWDQIREVLIYATRFNEDFSTGAGPRHRTLGMVGTGALNRMMILSKPDLLQGFRAVRDARNVGIHEFAHLVDKSDGVIDGVPGAALPREAVRPWMNLMRRKMQEMRRGDSDIDPYGLTNEAEFFAVTSEYFFERPERMKRKHPELYEMLSQIFRQDMRARGKAMIEAVKSRGEGPRRNDPCPCGSGEKYKRCCGRR